eukprot:bmy_17977T0
MVGERSRGCRVKGAIRTSSGTAGWYRAEGGSQCGPGGPGGAGDRDGGESWGERWDAGKGLRFEVVPSRFKEKLHKASFATPYAYAVETAKQKALEAVGATILEKPVDKQDAYRMLSRRPAGHRGLGVLRGDHGEVLRAVRGAAVGVHQQRGAHAGGYGIQALGGMLVENVHGDFLNVVGFPLNHFCKELARLYYPPRPEDLQRVKHDSIPAVDTFENLSDTEGGGSDPDPSAEGGRGGEEADGDRSQAPGALDAALNGADSRPPFPTGLLELMDGFKASKVLFTACKLKLFDVLKDQGPLKAVDVARKLDACAGGTEQLLDVCAALGLLEKTHRGYSNTEVATLHLVSDGEHSLLGLAEYNDAHVWGVFTRLRLAVREGAGHTRGALGVTEEEEHLPCFHHQSTEMTLQFMRAMHSLSKLTAHHVATAFDLSRFTSACDLGGCTGILAHELAQEYPHLQVTVFDLPEVIELSGGFQRGGRQTERIHFVPGDFFKDSLPEADLYILSRILQDWPDDRLHKLLSRISSSCKPDSFQFKKRVHFIEEAPRPPARHPVLSLPAP